MISSMTTGKSTRSTSMVCFQAAGAGLSGSVGDLISQTMDYTGNAAADAKSSADTQQTAVQALNQRLDSEYGVNVDEEMARLLELQNAYSANARVISAVQDLMSKLLDL